jgi:hypothetical protein
MDKTLEQILKLLDKADDLNAKIRDKVESSLDEYENDSEDEFDDSEKMILKIQKKILTRNNLIR